MTFTKVLNVSFLFFKIAERTTEGEEREKRQGKHMGRPGQDEKTLKRAIKLDNERETYGMCVKDIVEATGVPR